MTFDCDARIRRAEPADLDALRALERRCFDLDAQSRRSLRYLITRANAACLIWPAANGISADVILLFRARSSVARVYSIAVDVGLRGRGVAIRLLEAAERVAVARGCDRLRAEARWDNAASRALFARAGYREIARLPDYYPQANGRRGDGVRLEKIVTPKTR